MVAAVQGTLTMIGLQTLNPKVFWNGVEVEGIVEIKVENEVGKECAVKLKLKGTNEERLAMAANAGSYIGKYLTVEYEMLSKDGVPQKPVGQYFRQVDANGEASE